jgi:hypothetical protein
MKAQSFENDGAPKVATARETTCLRADVRMGMLK